MKKMILFSAIALITSASCNNTQLISSWKAPNQTKSIEKYNKILIVGLTGSKDRELRENIENSVAKKLQEKGISVETSTQAYGPTSFRSMNEESAVKMVNDKGFDGVIVLALLDKKQESSYTPGYSSSTPYALVRNRWYGNYSVLYDRVYNPGYYTTTTDYTLEANLYRTKGDKLLYSAQAKSFDPNSSADLASGFSKALVQDMISKGVIMK